MKVAILTFSTAENYGAQLQAFGLQYALRKQHIEAFHIRIADGKGNTSIKHKVKALLNGKSRHAFKTFSERWLRFYEGEYNDVSAESLNEYFDAFLSGSDQVFNMARGIDPVFFQRFVLDERRKLSYAASMGIRQVPVELKEEAGCALNRFDTISVREQDAVQELQNYTTTPIVRNIDPVFLLTVEEWDRVCIEPVYKKPYIFVYGTQMTDEIIHIAHALKDKTGYKIFSVFPMKGAQSLYLKIGPAEFIGYVKNAAYIVTTSFHCTAFSMLYEKNIIEVLHSTTGSRARSLLEVLDKTECIYSGKDFDLTQKISYTGTREIIEQERQAGYRFLREHLT